MKDLVDRVSFRMGFGKIRFILIIVALMPGFIEIVHADPITPLPRIGVRAAEPFAQFYNTETGREFRPIGSSYVRLYEVGSDRFHSTFAVGQYDAAMAEAALQKMADSGYTVVRVWCYHGHPTLQNQNPPVYSIEGPYATNVPDLYQPYLDNLFDFLERATRHGIYVQLAIDRAPRNNYYDSMVNAGYPEVTGFIHREYMVSGAITAKEIYISQLLQSIIDHNPALLSTIFAYEIRNEIHSRTDEEPFSEARLWAETAAGIYNMESPADRQACQDDNVTLFLNTSVAAIKDNDPDALVTTSVFTFWPVGKDGLAGNGLLPRDMTDHRWPIQPGVLVDTDLDFVSVHGYIPHDWDDELGSTDWSLIDKTQKPFLCGEFGAHRWHYENVFDAAEALYSHREDILNSGFRGALLFTWDTFIHTRWTMMEDDEIINERLKPKAWYSWQFDRDGFTQFWTPGNSVAAMDAFDGTLRFDIVGWDPYIYSPTCRIDADTFRYLAVTLDNMTAGVQAQVFWTTQEDGTWNESKSITFPIAPNAGRFKPYVVDMSKNPAWSGVINQIRFDPVENAVVDGSYAISDIAFRKDYQFNPADVSQTGRVDYLDFAVLAFHWLQEGVGWHNGDLTGDLAVGLDDLVKLAENWLWTADH